MPTRHLTTDQKVGGSSPFGRASDQGRDQRKRRLRPSFFPMKCRDLPHGGTVVLRWCSVVTVLSGQGFVPPRADQCVCVPPSPDHGLGACRPVVDHYPLWTSLWISPVGYGAPAARTPALPPAPIGPGTEQPARRQASDDTPSRHPARARCPHLTGHPSRPAGARRQARRAPPRAATTRAGRMPNNHHAPCREPGGRRGLRCTDLADESVPMHCLS